MADDHGVVIERHLLGDRLIVTSAPDSWSVNFFYRFGIAFGRAYRFRVAVGPQIGLG